MLLTAAHVIGGLFPWPTKETNVVGYGDLRDEEPHETLTTPTPAVSSDLGRLERSIPPSLCQSCSVDAAIAQVSSDRELRNHLNGNPILGVRDISTLLDTDIPVEMYGACSNLRQGILNTAPVTERLALGKSSHRVFYERACVVRSTDSRPMAVAGDSGSVLIDDNHRAIAMVVGRIGEEHGPDAALATPIAPALNALEVDVYTGEMTISTPRVAPFSAEN